MDEGELLMKFVANFDILVINVYLQGFHDF